MTLEALELDRVDPDREAEPLRVAAARLGVVDCDVHPTVRSLHDLTPFLPARWRQYLRDYGLRPRHPFAQGEPYPKAAPRAARRDAWAPEGGPPGSSLAFMRDNYFDRYDIDVHRDFVQILLLTRAIEPLGKRRFWPIYEAAAAHGLPVAIHVFGYSGHAVTGAGWPSYYCEEMTGHSGVCQNAITSLVLEGVFERYPELKVVKIEGGFGWLPALTWRLDRHWARLRAEVPHVKRPPSEYLREQLFITTQPIEEPERQQHLIETMEWVGWDRLLFATDYPHWDFDNPLTVVPKKIGVERRRQIYSGNARGLYRLD
jgi:hypothetical protein